MPKYYFADVGMAALKSLSKNITDGYVVYSGETKEKNGQKYVNFRESGGIVSG